MLLTALAVATVFAYDYWQIGRFLESTDNAYIQADYTTVAPKISGYITEVLVGDNEAVTAGQVLARIDDRDFQVALDQAHADVATADATLGNLDAQIAQQQSVIDQDKADIASDKASLDLRDRRQYPLRQSDEDRLRLRAARPAGRDGAAREDGGAAQKRAPACWSPSARSTC